MPGTLTSAAAKTRVRLRTMRISPFETECTVPSGARTVVRRSPTSSTVPETAADGDGVTLVVLALHDDEDAHEVVEHDRLAGQRQGRQEESEGGQQATTGPGGR